MLIGIIFLLFSMAPWVLPGPFSLAESGIFAICWAVGYLSICDHIIIRRRHPGQKVVFVIPKWHVLAIGILFALLIEFFGNWIWKMWYYPQFPVVTYFVAMPFILAIYFYFLLKGYLAIRALLLPFKKRINVKGDKDKTLLKLIGLLGVFGLVYGLSTLLTKLKFGGLSFFNSFGEHHFNLMVVFIVCFSVFFILEYIEYHEREDTFVQHLWHGDWVPLASVVVASAITSISMEMMNLPMQIWTYTNWPGPHISLLGNLPLAIFIVWPIQYLVLIGFYRVFYKKEAIKLWD